MSPSERLDDVFLGQCVPYGPSLTGEGGGAGVLIAAHVWGYPGKTAGLPKFLWPLVLIIHGLYAVQCPRRDTSVRDARQGTENIREASSASKRSVTHIGGDTLVGDTSAWNPVCLEYLQLDSTLQNIFFRAQFKFFLWINNKWKSKGMSSIIIWLT